MFFYSDTGPRTNLKINIWKMNGSRAYLRHFENFLYLHFMAKNGTREERIQAEREITICRRKLQFWQRHPNYVEAEVQPKREQMVKDWKGRA